MQERKFPELLRSWMEHRSMDQRQLSRAMGSHESTVSRLLQGSIPSAATLANICKALRISSSGQAKMLQAIASDEAEAQQEA